MILPRNPRSMNTCTRCYEKSPVIMTPRQSRYRTLKSIFEKLVNNIVTIFLKRFLENIILLILPIEKSIKLNT